MPLCADIPIFSPPLALTVAPHGSSAWARSYRIDSTNDAGEEESYFMKVATSLLHITFITLAYTFANFV
jgi:hypothetical protein